MCQSNQSCTKQELDIKSNVPALPVKGELKLHKYRENKLHKSQCIHQKLRACKLEKLQALQERVKSPKRVSFGETSVLLAEPVPERQTGGLKKYLSSTDQPNPENAVSIIVESCLRYLEANATDCVGLFRVAGAHHRVGVMRDYAEYDICAQTDIDCIDVFMREHPEFTAHDVASFLKRFIGSMFGDESLIMYNCFVPLTALIRNKCPSHLIGEKCKRVLDQLLVPARRLLLARLCTFLHEFSKHEAKTKMNCANLAVCFGNLMEPPPEDNGDRKKKKKKKKLRSPLKKRKEYGESAQASALARMEKTKLCVSVITVLIEQSQHVFKDATTR